MRKLLHVLIAFTLCATAFAADMNYERARMRDILNIVSRDIQRNFYDPQMKGIDWEKQTVQARARIDKADSVGEMLTAIFWLADSVNDSHTVFLPPGHPTTAKFGFEAMAVGDKILVTELKKGGAAASAGLKLGDQIVTVNGMTARREDFDLMMLYFRALRPVARMQLSIIRYGSMQTLTIDGKQFVRPAITDLTDFETVWQLIRESENEKEYTRWSTTDDGIGYIKLPSFLGVEDAMSRATGKLKNVKALVVDLRSNPGGAITTLAEFGGYFYGKDTVMANVKTRKGDEPIKARNHSTRFSVPVFVLVDSRSASAAEIFARTMQLQKTATVIGDVSSGRVSAARIFPQKIGAEIVVPFATEITIGQVIFSDGKQIEKVGVKPDILCLPTATDLAAEKDVCYSRALEAARAQMGIAAGAKVQPATGKGSSE